jgi:hypothetical protein
MKLRAGQNNNPEPLRNCCPTVGIEVDTLQQITDHLPWGFQTVTPPVIADQQKIVDPFFSLKLIPKNLDVS